ncbi:MAG TPA: P-loop NTPase fold protein [Panacibacter sp.]|nr:P-loop NTPase fold protein [Panacibacter sp.]
MNAENIINEQLDTVKFFFKKMGADNNAFFKKYYTPKSKFFAFVLLLIILFFVPLRGFYEAHVIAPYLSLVEPQTIPSIAVLILFILTALLFTYYLNNLTKVSSNMLLWHTVIFIFYIIARFSGRYKFVSFSNLGITFIYYTDWIILSFIFIWILFIKSKAIKPPVPVYKNIPFVIDTPLISDKGDLFDRAVFARQLAEKILSEHTTNSSVAIGINGPWGSGKTSFLNMIREEINLQNDRVIIDYNPWKSNSPSEIVKDFFQSLIQALSPYNKTLVISLRQYADKLAEIDGNIYTKSIKVVTDFFSEKAPDKNSLYAYINKEISAINKQFIVFIDDLDRLDNAEIIEVIRLIRNTASFKNITFLVSYDKGYVISAIKTLNEYNHEFYLEKIFQFEFVLPVYEYSILKQQLFLISKNYLTEHSQEQFNKVLYNINEHSKELKPYFLRTMRDVIRFSNNFFFETNYLQGEVNLGDLFSIHLLKLKYQRIYELIPLQKDLFFIPFFTNPNEPVYYIRLVGEEDQSETNIQVRNTPSNLNLNGETVKPKSIFQSYLKDHAEELQLNAEETDFIWYLVEDIFEKRKNEADAARNRINIPQNFYKYFAYHLADKDFSNTEFEKICKAGEKEFEKYLETKIKKGNTSSLIDKLFTVNEFASAEEQTSYYRSLFWFGNLIFGHPLQEVYEKNLIAYFNNTKTVASETGSSSQGEELIKSILKNPASPPLFELRYLKLSDPKNPMLTRDDLVTIQERESTQLKEYQKGFNVTTKINYSHIALIKGLKELALLTEKEFSFFEIQKVSNHFWENNNPEDYGIIIKKVPNASFDNMYQIDLSNILFGHSEEANVSITNFKNFIKNILSKTPDSSALKEFDNFINKLDKNNSAQFDFKILKPGCLKQGPAELWLQTEAPN